MIILYESRGNKNEYFSWILMSIGMLLLGIGDTGFGYTALKDVQSLADEAIWDIIFSLSYIFIIGSLAYELAIIKSRRNQPLPNPS
jgi:Na+-transporting NADH:ubiquinone oxidoreductase subunit NqrD